MLHRLYKPILWKALKVDHKSVDSVLFYCAYILNLLCKTKVNASVKYITQTCSFRHVFNRFQQATNAEVRANATLLFTEAFPIHDPSMSSEMVDQAVQKQLDLLFVCQQLIPYCMVMHYGCFVIITQYINQRNFSKECSVCANRVHQRTPI